MASQTRVKYHSDTCQDFMAEAWEYLEQDDLLQASEKGWGAAEQAVKAAAEARGWTHDGHRQLYTAIDRLVQETGDGNIRRAFSMARDLHINFYDGIMPRETVDAYLFEIGELVEKLERLRA